MSRLKVSTTRCLYASVWSHSLQRHQLPVELVEALVESDGEEEGHEVAHEAGEVDLEDDVAVDEDGGEYAEAGVVGPCGARRRGRGGSGRRACGSGGGPGCGCRSAGWEGRPRLPGR